MEAATLLYLQEAIATVRDKASLFRIITDKLRLIWPFDAIGIVTFEGPGMEFKRVFLREYAGMGDPYPGASDFGQQPTPVAGSPIAEFLLDPRLTQVAVADVRARYPDFPPLGPLSRLGVEWLVAVPLRAGGQLVGLMNLASRRQPALTDADRDLLEKIGQQVALAVQNARAFEEADRRVRESALHLAVNNALLRHQDRDSLLRALTTEIDRVIPHVFFGIRIQSESDGPVELFTSLAKVADPATGLPVFRFVDAYSDRDSDYAQKLIWQREARDLYTRPGVYVGAAYDELARRYRIIRHIREEHGIESVLYVPLTLRRPGRPVLMLAEKRPHAFTAEHLETLLGLAPQLSLALDNLFAFEQIDALRAQLEQEKSYLLEEIRETTGYDEIIGTAPVLRSLLGRVEQVAATDTTVLIQGETGTGKELIARALHNRSPRRAKPLIKVNCAALPAQLIESELFGHEKGAFTGALDRRQGKFELADGGTIFLDEIGELPLDLQAKLLRVLQEKEIERVGGRREIRVDVRVIAATNRVLEEEVNAGRFRQDLYYRLTAFPLRLPTLRERTEDLPLLVTHFQEKLARRMGKPRRAIRPQDLAALQAWRWPGNVRELEHVVEQAVILSTGPSLNFEGFFQRAPQLLAASPQLLTPNEPSAAAPLLTPMEKTPTDAEPPAQLSLREQERQHIIRALRQTAGRVSGPKGAAQLLDINPKTLEARMRRLGIRRTVGVTAD